uniref:Carboxypeptidase B2 n=1 Tax=Xenopus tropicalis TaxID=8364 RepID=A0A6I8S7P9_XENTR
MKNYLIICILGLFVVDFQVSAEDSDQVLYVLPRTDQQVEILKNITSQPEIVLWKPDSNEHIMKNKEVHFYVNESFIDTVKAELNESSILYMVLVNNAQELIEQQTFNDTSNQRSATSFYEQYHTLEDIYYWMQHMVEKHSDMLQRIHIGYSFENRPLYVLKVSGKEKTAKHAVWIDCGIHAREWISPAFCLWFVGHAVEYYGVDLSMTKLLRYLDFYILPVMNADGYQFSWTAKNRMWRKNRSKYTKSNCIGTDLNRNFDAGWCGPGASSDPCHEIYCGPYAESEPEVSAVVSFLKKHQNVVKGYITVHSYSQMVLFPYSYTNKKSKDHDELIYSDLAPGGSDDWAYDLGIKYSFTFELRDKGMYGFLLPPQLIKPTCSEGITAVKIIAAHIVKNL